MLGVYTHVYKPDHLHDPAKVLENGFTLDEISQLFTVRGARGFEVYSNYVEFFKALDALPQAMRIYHEVIFEQHQKLKFDVDAKYGDLIEFKPIHELCDYDDDQPVYIPTTPEEKYNHVIRVVSDTVKTAFFVTYGMEAEIVEGRSVGNVDGIPKYGSHLVVLKYHVSGSAQAQEFTRRVLEYLPTSYRKFIDAGVNRRLQNFRMVCCHKGDGRVKRIYGSDHPRESMLITETRTTQLLPDLTANAKVQRFNTRMRTEDINKVLDCCGTILRDNRLHSARGGMLIFSRLRPSHCALCGRVHDSDNTVIVNVAQGPNDTVLVYQNCRKYKQEQGGTGVKIGEFTSDMFAGEDNNGPADNNRPVPAPQPYVEREIAYALKNIGGLYPARSLFDDLDAGSKIVYDEPALRPFALSRTLVVHAMMKMGKTKALNAYLQQHFNNKLRRDVIRYVSFRQTFSGNIKEKFADFTLYSDVKGPLSQDRLIVQVESLHRLEIGIESPDLLILDECESIFEQFDSGLLRSFNESFAKFQYLLKYSKHVVCMDAYISDRTYRIIRAIRGTDGISYHHNIYKNGTADNYHLTGSRGRWLAAVYTQLDDDRKIAIQISSLAEARAIESGLRKKYPNKTIKLYSSETLQSEKREHFANVSLYWAQCDVLMYTPTVSAGVSFELKHFDCSFGYFTDESCPVETCMQMIGRIRDLSTCAYYIYFSATGSNLPTDIEDIRRTVYDRRENLMKTYDETGLRVEYGPQGDVIHHTGDYFQIWLENCRMRNLSRNSFVRRFIHIAAIAGANFTHMTADWCKCLAYDEDEQHDIVRNHNQIKTGIADTTCEEIANATDIDDASADEIATKLRSQVDVTQAEKLQWERYRLRADYRFTGEIDNTFVKRYRDPKVRRIYRNLCRLGTGDPLASIERIKEEERAVYQHVMGLEERSRQGDISRRYVHDQHRYAIGLLLLCGWKGLADRSYQHQLTLADRLRTGEKLYWDTIDAACREFQIKPPSRLEARVNRENDERYCAIMVAPVSKILKIMYGATIVVKSQTPDTYVLTQCELFAKAPSATIPYLPV